MFFCLDAKEPKNQVGKSSAKKRYFFLKIPELERWLRLRSATGSVLSDRIRLVCAQPDRVCELRFRMASTPLSHRVCAQ